MTSSSPPPVLEHVSNELELAMFQAEFSLKFAGHLVTRLQRYGCLAPLRVSRKLMQGQAHPTFLYSSLFIADACLSTDVSRRLLGSLTQHLL